MSRSCPHETANPGSGAKPRAAPPAGTRCAAARRTEAERSAADYLTGAILGVALGIAPARAMPLAAHHAVYKLSLHGGPGNGDVIGLSGSMTYDLTDLCSAWATAQHLAMTLSQADGKSVVMVSDYATLERKDGSRMEFHTRQSTDGSVTEALDGTAKLDARGGSAAFTAPEAATVSLPAGTKFPVAHTEAVIDAAAAGRRFENIALFDGTSREADDTFVVTQGWDRDRSSRFPALRGLKSGVVHVSFFARNGNEDAGTPDYEIGMRYFGNGVADDLVMNFGDFAADGELATLDLRAPAHCAVNGEAP